MFELNPDRMMIFFESADAEWVILRLIGVHYTIFETDLLDILEIAALEIPKWLEYIIKVAQKLETRPIPEAPFPQTLPSLNTILNVVPMTIDSGMSFPIFDGYGWGGLVINPGGEPLEYEPTFPARLCDFTFKGLNFWAQSGTLNAAMCLVSQALLHYRRSSLAKIIYPLLDLTGYLPGQPVSGAMTWYVPGLESQGFGTAETSFAHNEIIFYPGSGQYYIDRNFYTDCPVPSFPDGHFMRPLPGMKMKIQTGWGVLGRMRCWLVDDYIAGDNLETVPFGCQPGWPSDEFLSAYNLINDDSMGINSLSTIIPNPLRDIFFAERATDNANFGDVVVDLTEAGNSVQVAGFSAPLLMLAASLLKYKDNIGATGVDEGKLSTIGGEPITVAGKRVLI